MHISDSDVKDIKFKLNVISKIFESALSPDDDKKDKLTFYDVDISPHKYYNFRFLDKFLEIRRINKSSLFCIRCENFIPDFDSLPFNYSKECDYLLKENTFGHFSDFNSALSAFVDIVYQVMRFKVNELF